MSTPKEIKEYLQQIEMIDTKIDIKMKERSSYYDMIQGFDYSSEKVFPTNKTGNPTELAVMKLNETEQTLNEEIDKLVELKRNAQKMLDDFIKEPLQYKVLYLRYFQFKSWEQIAQETFYTKQWIIKAHGLALLELSKRV